MHAESTTGIPDPDRPGHWLVPPWPANARFFEVVGHFLRYRPSDGQSTTRLFAYYAGYLPALDAATDTPRDALSMRWRSEMRECVNRCAEVYRKKLAATFPAHQEMVS